MSTGLNCLFQEVSPLRWFYLLEHSHAPKNAWDWREHSTAYGPFPTFEAADKHLDENHANPGGAEIRKFEPGYKPDAIMRGLIKTAQFH